MDTVDNKWEKLATLIAKRDLLFYRQKRRLDKNLAVNLRELEISCYDVEVQMRKSKRKYALLKELPKEQRSEREEEINRSLEEEFSRSRQETEKLKLENKEMQKYFEPDEEQKRAYTFIVLNTHPYFSTEKEQEYAKAFSALLAGEWSKIYQMVNHLKKNPVEENYQKNAQKYEKWIQKLEEEIQTLDQKFPLSSSVYIENEKWVSKRQGQLRSIFTGFKREKDKFDQKIKEMM